MTEFIVHSPLRNRAYVRRFDHDEAARRRAAGESPAALAAEYGVTREAVYKATTPGSKRRGLTNARLWRAGVCETCDGPAMRLVGTKLKTSPDGRVLCDRCRRMEMRKNVVLDARGNVSAVHCLHGDCANGERWQPPRNFPKGNRYRDLREGGFNSLCRACNTRAKKQYRDARKVPCANGCGRMVDSVDRRDKSKPPLCNPCARRPIESREP